MGFWKALGSFLEAILGKAGEISQDAMDYKQRYENLDTAELKRKASSTSKLAEKTACLSILQDRADATARNTNHNQ